MDHYDMSLLSHTRDIHAPMLTPPTKLWPELSLQQCRYLSCIIAISFNSPAGLAQSVERKTLNLKAAGSTPAFGYS
ncbi:hypothetical protein ACN42_g8222 [Penicillium freii]|uniref:Uncharacterized protein n=1 Tax=Penicillium freii TaxID=48697 RepID=A0A101ME43_PENFR|nr:hypothetical protein ACN42_g8222 [Penicillium freii]